MVVIARRGGNKIWDCTKFDRTTTLLYSTSECPLSTRCHLPCKKRPEKRDSSWISGCKDRYCLTWLVSSRTVPAVLCGLELCHSSRMQVIQCPACQRASQPGPGIQSSHVGHSPVVW